MIFGSGSGKGKPDEWQSLNSGAVHADFQLLVANGFRFLQVGVAAKMPVL